MTINAHPAICPFCDTQQKYRYIAEATTMRLIYPKSPACRYHVLFVPKRHIVQFDELTNSELMDLRSLLKQLVEVSRQGLPQFTGYNLMSNNGGPAVRQHVMHCHMHVFLRLAGETVDPFEPEHTSRPTDLSEAQLSDMHTLQTLMSQSGRS